MDINTRIMELIDARFQGKKSRFASFLGVYPSVVDNIVGKRSSKPSYDLILKISSIEDLSLDWLIVGKGNMFRTDAVTNNEGDPTVLHLIDKIAEQAKEIGRLEQALEEAQRKKGSPAYDAHTGAIADAG